MVVKTARCGNPVWGVKFPETDIDAFKRAYQHTGQITKTMSRYSSLTGEENFPANCSRLEQLATCPPESPSAPGSVRDTLRRERSDGVSISHGRIDRVCSPLSQAFWIPTLLAASILAGNPLSAQAQPAGTPLEQAQQAYDANQYEQALKLAEQVLQSEPKTTVPCSSALPRKWKWGLKPAMQR